MMNHKLVESLETRIAEGITVSLKRLGPSRLPVTPSTRLVHLMAKAAVAVYEAAAHEADARAALVDSGHEEE